MTSEEARSGSDRCDTARYHLLYGLVKFAYEGRSDIKLFAESSLQNFPGYDVNIVNHSFKVHC